MKKILIFILSIFILCGCSQEKEITEKVVYINNDVYKKYSDAHVLKLNGSEVLLDDKKVNEYDYTWHISPEQEDEYYTGNKPEENKEVYLAHDIIYYPEISEESFVKQNYDGEMEWVTYYTNNEKSQYIFSTLPVLGEELPVEMMHSESEAYNNPVLHINKEGSYILEGDFNGQILIDLGEDAFNDNTKKVTIILNGANVKCDVGPAIMFKNVYEADNTWEDKKEYTNIVDISDAGAKVVIVDGTENNFTGANVYRLLKPTYKEDSTFVQKKRYKIDGAFYSCMSMFITAEERGTGILNITSTTYEGLDTELHLTLDSGYINIVSQDDGINVNEDDVSVFTMNGGRLTIFAGQGAEGDVIDSNGYIKINGGKVLGTTPSFPDEILDSNNGNEVSESATVISSGEARSNLGEMPGNMTGMDFNNFDPNQMRQSFNPNGMGQDFDPNNMPEGFDYNNIPGGMQQPPNKPQ